MSSKYQEVQRERAISLIQSGNKIFDGAKGGNMYRTKNREFILIDSLKNLYSPIREQVRSYFKGNGISWWGGYEPTGHVLSSQIACLNHLFLIRNDFQAVSSLLKMIDPDLLEPIIIETDKYSSAYIQFEAVSDYDHLYEKNLTRGSNCTSIDALILAKHKNNTIWLIPIEWKFTEFYGNQNKAVEVIKREDYIHDKGKERQARYNNLIFSSNQLKIKNLDCYYYEPFYQLMRQTLWAEQVIKFKDKERYKAIDFLHVHIIPTENEDLLKKSYKCSGMGMEETWRSHLLDQSKYKIIAPQNLMSGLLLNSKYQSLIDYLQVRYW
jgi:hypothetical protein